MPTLYCNIESIPKSLLPSQTTGRAAPKGGSTLEDEDSKFRNIDRISALVINLRCIAFLIENVLMEKKYKYILTSRFQTDCLELRFSKYRQMSGGRFLFGLREM